MLPENLSAVNKKKRLPEQPFLLCDQLSSVMPSMRSAKDGAEIYSDS